VIDPIGPEKNEKTHPRLGREKGAAVGGTRLKAADQFPVPSQGPAPFPFPPNLSTDAALIDTQTNHGQNLTIVEGLGDSLLPMGARQEAEARGCGDTIQGFAGGAEMLYK